MTGRNEAVPGGQDWVKETGRGPGRPPRGAAEGDEDPLYVRIANDIEKLIHQGKLVPGDRIGSQTELAQQYNVSITTSRKAHEALRTRKLAHTVAGAGTFVGPEDTTPAPAVMPAYLVIADELATRIRAGDIPAGGQIPSRRMLAKRFQTSLVTAGEATAVLREKGWVYTVADMGSFVTSAERWPSEQEWQKTIARHRGRREER
ncbi:GntR family transcriptional regulator [Acrocarpospora macrocephala]